MRKYHLQIRLVFLLPFPSGRWVFPSLAQLPWRDLQHNAEYRWRERTPHLGRIEGGARGGTADGGRATGGGRGGRPLPQRGSRTVDLSLASEGGKAALPALHLPPLGEVGKPCGGGEVTGRAGTRWTWACGGGARSEATGQGSSVTDSSWHHN